MTNCDRCLLAKGEDCVCTCESFTDEEWEDWDTLKDDCPYYEERDGWAEYERMENARWKWAEMQHDMRRDSGQD